MSTWADRTADRSPSVQRSRDRSVKQAKVLVDAGRRLVLEKGHNFTINELVKEAGVALQTFYRYFAGKDELMLAVLEDLIADACELYRAHVAGIEDPVERLHDYITSVFALLDNPVMMSGARFVASEHWRLSQSFPGEVAQATRPFADMLETEITAGTEAGELRSADPERDAWLIAQMVLSVFHQRSYQTIDDPRLAADVWRFCLAALGGAAD
jgi:TetR/AcrR family transcriptional regulator